MIRMKMNRHNSIDEYNNHLRKIRIIYQFSLVIAMIISLPLAAIRIYMLNGFGKQWEYVIAAESRISIAEKSRFSRSGLSYEYEHNGTTYHGFQPIGKSSIQNMSKYHVCYNSRYPVFNYINCYREKKIKSIKTLTFAFDVAFLYFFLVPYLIRYVPSSWEMRNRRFREKYK